MHYTPLFLSATLVLPVVSRSVVVMPRNATAYSTTVADLHNSFRQRHNAPNLTWDETLANEAAATAGTCVFKIDSSQGTGNYGQNIDAQGSTLSGPTNDPTTFVANAINGWYKEEKNFESYYGVEAPPFNANYLAFTQVVWKGSVEVGCATKYCPAGTIFAGFQSWFTVCNYSPPGNYGGEFADNISPPS